MHTGYLKIARDEEIHTGQKCNHNENMSEFIIFCELAINSTTFAKASP